jgi:WD40 repeat protein
MTQPITLAQMAGGGVRFETAEAIAVVQQLIASAGSDTAVEPPLGPPSLDNVWLDESGSVICHAGATSAAVLEMGILLQAMLPNDGPTRVPGALRYTIARALLDVQAPPYDSIADFSGALQRFEQGDRATTLRALFARATAARLRVPAPVPTAASRERRRHGPSVSELRRQLREADRDRYRLNVAYAAIACPPEPVAVRETAPGPIDDRVLERTFDEPRLPPPTARVARRRWRSIVLAAAAIAVAFGLGYSGVLRLGRGDGTPSSSPVDAGADQAPPAAASRAASAADDPVATVGEHSVAGPEPAVVRAAGPAIGAMFSPSFAPDGTLFFHTGRGPDEPSALKAARVTGGPSSLATLVDDGARNYHVQPSPTGDRIAYDSDRDGERGVYIASRDGRNSRKVSGSGYAAAPTWSADEQHLAFVRAEPDRPRVWNLWLLTFDTGEMERVTNFRFGQTWNASWFPDGRRICYAHEDRLYLRDLATGSTREFESPIKGHLVRTPAVSPDGRRVIFQVARSGAWLLDVRRGSMTRVLDDPTAEEFAWSPDGRVAFHSRRDGRWGIWLMKPA